MSPPQILSLGAGVQSTALLLLSALGTLPKLDGAIFSDTGWEPKAVYDHLDRIEREIAGPAGIPIHRVSSGNIRNDALDPDHRFASMPLYVVGPCQRCAGNGIEDTPAKYVETEDGDTDETPAYRGTCRKCKGTGKQDGMTRRQCTSEYKLKPIKEKVRELLGAPPREDGKPGRVPRGLYVEQWVGISTDERDRALDEDGNRKTGDVSYSRNRYPLLDLGMDRDACRALLTRHGFETTPKSACIGCPFHTNRQWRALRDESPAEWDDAVAFDAAIRAGSARANATGSPLLGQAFLHRARIPLSEAPIDRVTSREWADRQGDVLQAVALAEFEESLEDDSSLNGCSPFSCTTGEDVTHDDDADTTPNL